MSILDWIVLSIPLTIVLSVAVLTQKYMKSVADFMSGGRVAGRYLLTIAKGEMGAGAVVFVALFEKIAQSGFTTNWWIWLQMPILLVVAISGFVIYRYRETRAMTLAQFLEIRYSKRFRVFAGVLGFVAGIMNFGIIPAVGSHFMVYILGLPREIILFAYPVPTFVLLMGVFLSITLLVTLTGGLITMMVSDCIEGILSQLSYLVLIGALLLIFSWDQIAQTLSARPPGQSMVNPFDSQGIKDFNIFYVMMMTFLTVYGTMAWQNASAYNSAALNPHESRMASVLGRWREMGKIAVITLLAVCAITFLKHPDFATQAAPVPAIVAQIPEAQIQKQMELPVAVSFLLPVGIKGLLCAILVMGMIGGDSTHLHSWGSIFVQDVLMPFRKKPLAPRQHIRALRLSIVGVAIFAFFFGMLFKQTEYIIMWFQITTAIFVGGAGAVIIGGLYWSRGTVPAAWAAMIVGSTLSGGGILVRQIYGPSFPWNGVEIAFWASLIAIATYVVVSLLTCRESFNMDRMLHRGPYAATIEKAPAESPATPERKISLVGKIVGIDSNFTRADKWIAGSLFGWGILWFAVVIIGSLWNIVAPWPESVWLSYWHVVGIAAPIFIALVTGVWFTWGGIRDMKQLFIRLRLSHVNPLDDGTVINHQNLDEAGAESRMEYPTSQAKE
ncbi:solute:Na+ symporter, SSS family [Terrimicrobium sacchariphilum]|uniref:Solute:Na+ symporter, SSS family n=1 Tax=Terrimicrobium sacchariphilum TaxID=690879 RepID=A0A146G6N8_TERSA|nr:sodium:proline symporter [Terrimicrobium sacchariphilum]GAT32597.1 solute:Na+ symporter, SSS family [Terrimicrobium sacchariphilum]